MEIYTIGHSNYPFEKLIDMLKKYNINCVVDIRAIPYSKYNNQYNREIFQKSLKDIGILYVYMGAEFGVIRKVRESYNEEGYSEFKKVKEEKIFKDGIDRLKNGCNKGYKIVLLGAMQEPIRCPRAILVGRELVKYGFDVKHIMHEGNLKSQNELEDELLEKYFKDRNQLTMDILLGKEISRDEMIEEAYILANREIGQRISKNKQ